MRDKHYVVFVCAVTESCGMPEFVNSRVTNSVIGYYLWRMGVRQADFDSNCFDFRGDNASIFAHAFKNSARFDPINNYVGIGWCFGLLIVKYSERIVNKGCVFDDFVVIIFFVVGHG